MNTARQSGHALAITMVIMILFSLLSLTALRNALIDYKIAHRFERQQLVEERHLSALRHVETVVFGELLNPDTDLFRDFQAIEEDGQIALVIPIQAALGIGEAPGTGEYVNPIVNISRIASVEAESLPAPEAILLRAEILDPNNGHQLNAVFEISGVDISAGGGPATIRRLSLRKII